MKALFLAMIVLLLNTGVLSRVVEKRSSEFCREGKAPGNHPDPNNCHGFIMCDMAGNTHLMDCPGDLMFNPNLLNCDWPNNVDCEIGSGEPEY